MPITWVQHAYHHYCPSLSTPLHLVRCPCQPPAICRSSCITYHFHFPMAPPPLFFQITKMPPDLFHSLRFLQS
jgi:hypothetical protein